MTIVQASGPMREPLRVVVVVVRIGAGAGVSGATGFSGTTIRSMGAGVADDGEAGDFAAGGGDVAGAEVVFATVVIGAAAGVIAEEDLASGRGTSGRSEGCAASGEEDGVTGARCAGVAKAGVEDEAGDVAAICWLLFFDTAALGEAGEVVVALEAGCDGGGVTAMG